jgi:hypothetical protein
MSRTDNSEEALARIVEVAERALRRYPDRSDPDDYEIDAEQVITCTPPLLPERLLQDAAALARSVNPANAPLVGATAGAFADTPLDPMRIAVLTAKYWGPAPRRLTVSFMESTEAALRSRILSHMNAWAARCGISFVYTQGAGNVRISRGGGGYWSYLGTDILLIPKSRQTMNLQGFTMSTPESEYRRVVRHETGHTLGAPHEHMRKALVARIDREKAYAYFWATQRWDRATVDAQVLTPLDEASIMATPADQTSIMCYQLPGSITKDGKPIMGGLDINATDFAFMAKLYPRPGAAPQAYAAEPNGGSDVAYATGAAAGLAAPDTARDWDSSHDVPLEDALEEAELAV